MLGIRDALADRLLPTVLAVRGEPVQGASRQRLNRVLIDILYKTSQ